MSLQQKAVSSVFWSSIQTFGNQIIGFIVSLILARLLMPAEMGLIGMIGIFMGIGGILIGGGLTNSLIRTTVPDQDDYSTVFVYNVVGSVLIYLVMYLSAPWVADFYKEPKLISIIRLYCLSFIIQAFSAVQIAKLHKELNFKTETQAALLSSLVSGIVGCVLAYLGFGVMSLVWMTLAGGIVSVLMLWSKSGWSPSFKFNKEKFKTHFGFGNRMIATSLLEIFYSNLYNILIGKFHSAAQLGFFNRGDSLQKLPIGILTGILGKVTLPLFAEVKDDRVKLKQVYKSVMGMVVFVSAPILMLMCALAQPMFRFLFTEKWLPAVPYFQILCIAGLLHPLHMYNLNILMVKGRSDLFLKLEIAKKIILTVILVVSFFFGIYGLLWGQVLYSFIAYFVNSYYSGEFLDYNVKEQIKDISLPVLLSVILAAVVYLSDSAFAGVGIPDLGRLVIGSFIGLIIFLTGARFFKVESLKMIFELAVKNPKIAIPLSYNPVRKFFNF